MNKETLSPASLPLDGRIGIVTEGSLGIGRAIAAHFHCLGTKLVINYASNSDLAETVVSEINTKANRPDPVAVAIKADISNPEEGKTPFDQSEKEFGFQARILVNRAGVLGPKYPTLADKSVDDFDTGFNVNTRGSFLCCREAANRLIRDGSGQIITISASLVGASLAGYSAYAAYKAEVETMTDFGKGVKRLANASPLVD